MKYILLSLLLSFSLLQATNVKAKYTASEVPKKMSVKTKKARFYYLLVPAIDSVYKELDKEYQLVKKELDLNNTKESAKIAALKKEYKVKSDKALLMALKPHPRSIAIAQAAMESAWGTSRFFTKANNVFGMWNNDKSAPRIAASEKRGGKHTVWLSKYKNLEDSVRGYYKTLAKGRTYKEFREVKYASDDVFAMVKKLNRYSERGEEYTKEIASMIRYNKLTKYDEKVKND